MNLERNLPLEENITFGYSNEFLQTLSRLSADNIYGVEFQQYSLKEQDLIRRVHRTANRPTS